MSGTLDAGFNFNLPRINATDPTNLWPKGNYTLSVTSGCNTKLVDIVVRGYTATLSGYTATPICGGFNYVMNGTFDVPTAYQVVIVSAPSAGDVGQIRDLASTSASLPFNGLSPGTYVFGLRIKGGSTNVLTQTVVYNATSVITIDRNNTGGFVCDAGATNGTLTITASSASPGVGAILEYAISTDGGITYSAYQAGNTFTGLGAGNYYFKVKDGCTNEITAISQIGVAASPNLSVNDVPGNATFCAGTASLTVKLGLDVNIPSATYLWSGPGLSTNPLATNYQGLKNPVIALSDIPVGTNTYGLTITLGAPCNTTSTGSVNIIINGLPNLVINEPTPVCFQATVDLTTAAITAGSDAGLTYTYFTDAAGLIPIANPAAVAVSSTYYIKGSNGTCADIKPVTVTINPLPIASISYAAAPYCKRGTAMPTQTGEAGGTYTGDAGLVIFNATTGAIDLLNSTPGTHTVTYTFSNGSCSSSTTTIITINPTTLPTALADINAVCSASPTAPTLNDPCAGVLTATTSTVFPITTPGTTIVTWVFDYGNDYMLSVNQNVIITLPTAPIITPASATNLCPGGAIDLSATAATAYRWYKDGVLIGGATSQIYNATTSGDYSVETGNGICYSVASAPVTVTVNQLPATPLLTITEASCAAPTATITVTSPIAGLTFSNNGVDYSNTTGIFSGLAAGSTYSITAKNASGCISNAVTGTLATSPTAPVLVINNPASVCAPSTIDLTSAAVTAGSTGGGVLSY